MQHLWLMICGIAKVCVKHMMRFCWAAKEMMEITIDLPSSASKLKPFWKQRRRFNLLFLRLVHQLILLHAQHLALSITLMRIQTASTKSLEAKNIPNERTGHRSVISKRNHCNNADATSLQFHCHHAFLLDTVVFNKMIQMPFCLRCQCQPQPVGILQR